MEVGEFHNERGGGVMLVSFCVNNFQSIVDSPLDGAAGALGGMWRMVRAFGVLHLALIFSAPRA